MKKNNKDSTIAKEWFSIGDNELSFAKAAFEDQDNYYAQICFLCQQAVEKYLKGFLVANKIRYKRTHDLESLIKECMKINKKFEGFLDECRILTGYYTPARYPVHIQVNVNKKKTKEAIEAAETIVSFVQKELKI
jgi:HEPN domain-containing protein